MKSKRNARLAVGRLGFRMLIAFVAIGGWISPRQALAMPTFPAVVRQTYSLKPGGTISATVDSCTFCHVAPGQTKRNPYGLDVQAALRQANTKTLTPAILKSIENKDSDGDGFPNGVEIAADTLPGDPASKPAGKPVSAPTAAAAQASSPTGPFALRTLLLPRHAQHPVVVHFPIALLVVSLLFDLLGYLKRNGALMTAGYYNLVAAGASAPLAVATGLLAWIFAFGQTRLTGILLYHLILGVLTTALIGVLWWLRARNKGQLSGRMVRAYLICGFVAFVIIALTGHLGGTLVQGE
ncbi:MAG TPA: DUF2231 domain-containing protein [Chthonomonadaceae bacterium]|nr:DUF2231 domain-containing protein [Chthonomonadaceae bacterium]